MSLLKMVKDTIAPVDEVADLTAKIKAERAAGTAGRLEIERLEAELLEARRNGAGYEEAQPLRDRIARARWAIDGADQVISKLEAQLGVAEAKKQHEKTTRHWRATARIYPKLRRAIEEAAALQVEAVKAREAAAADGVAVQTQIPVLAYMGFLFPDLVEIWSTEMDRVFAVPPRQPTPPPDIKRTPAEVAAAINALPPQAIGQLQAIARPGGAGIERERSTTDSQGLVRLNALPPPQPTPSRALDDSAPLEPGQVRVRARAGYPGPNGPCVDQQIIRLDRKVAELAVAISGAVEILPDDPAAQIGGSQ
jgi:hypothetical protein